MKHEIPSLYGVRCFDVAFHYGFRAVRRAKVLCGSCAVRGAEVLRNHEKSGGRMVSPRRCPGGAGDVRRQAAPRLATRDLEGERARARAAGSRNAVGCDK